MARGSCENNYPECPYRRHYSDSHHEYWPRNLYLTKVERTFRNLPENKQQLCRYEHDLAHQEEPPVKPSREEMLGAIAVSNVHLSNRKELGLV